ncbi:hypothetical protein GDO78_000932, partial [Eleutherodactylus coqui]
MSSDPGNFGTYGGQNQPSYTAYANPAGQTAAPTSQDYSGYGQAPEASAYGQQSYGGYNPSYGQSQPAYGQSTPAPYEAQQSYGSYGQTSESSIGGSRGSSYENQSANSRPSYQQPQEPYEQQPDFEQKPRSGFGQHQNQPSYESSGYGGQTQSYRKEGFSHSSQGD